ncbi:DsrE/DsrF/DrsH-like family protein [Gemmatimonadota bacterium]
MTEQNGRKVAIICSKGSLDMAYPGLILANAARMMGIDAMVFFTFWGLDIITEKKVDKLHAGLVGNPAAPMPHMLAGIPGMEAFATMMMKKKIEDIEIPPIRELIETLDAAGCELYACRMAMDMFDMKDEDLVPEVHEIIGAMDFFEKSEGAQTFFI